MTLRPLGENFVPGSVVVVNQIEFSERRWVQPTPGLQKPGQQEGKQEAMRRKGASTSGLMRRKDIVDEILGRMRDMT